MKSGPEAEKPAAPTGAFRPFVFAAIYAAGVVGLSVILDLSQLADAGILIGIVGFVIALPCALVFTPVFYVARGRLPGVAYFLLHLAVGVGLGAFYAAAVSYAREWHHYLYSAAALQISCASMGAWLYVVGATRRGIGNGRPVPRELAGGRAAALVVAIVLLPTIVATSPQPENPSCHNVFRGGRSTVSPSIAVDIRVPATEMLELGVLYDRFADEHALDSKGHPYYPESPQRSMCNDVIVFSAGGWFPPEGRHNLGVYVHEGGRDWEPLAADLVCRLQARWGESLSYFPRDDYQAFMNEHVAGRCPDTEPSAGQ